MAIIASDLVNGTSLNRTGFSATPDNAARGGAFAGSDLDVFGVTDRTVNPDFADDSAGSDADDDFGVLKTGETFPVFGAEDIDNGDNPGGGGTARWTFDIASASVLSDISIRFAAMGDFEAGDNAHRFTASIDGGPAIELFAIDADNDDVQTYTLEGGAAVTLNDPLKIDVDGDGAADGTITNDLTAFTTAALAGMSGSVLTIDYTAAANNGGDEVFVFSDIVVEGATTEVVAFDLVDSASLRLDAFTTSAPPFSSAGDIFGKTDASQGPPFAVVDESASTFPSDTQGVIDTATNSDTFFAIVDTVNGDNADGQPYTARWAFDVAGFADLALSLDVGAMGDFEGGDVFDVTYSFDGGTETPLFSFRADEDGTQTYTLAGGAVQNLDDPLVEQGSGIVLSNALQTFEADLAGTGTLLELFATGSFDGGSEALAIQNIIVEGAVDADAGPRLSITDRSVAEGDAGDTLVTFTVTLTNAAAGPFSVDFAAGDGTATLAGGDYADAAGTLDFDGFDGETRTFQVAVRGDTDFEADETASVTLGNVRGADDVTLPAPATLTIENDDAPPLTLISAIQGSGDSSPLVGRTVTVRAVVTADLQDSDDSDYNGFFLQEEDADADADAATSEGLFVFEGGNTVDVQVGDLVEITGTVSEFRGETQLGDVSSVSVVSSGNLGAVTPATVAFPVASVTTNEGGETIADLEAYEGMLVTVPTEMTVSDLFTLGRYGEVGTNSGGLIQNFTQANMPDAAAYLQFQEEVARRGLVIDDFFDNRQNLDPSFPAPGLNADTGNVLRAGDTVTGLTGVVAYRGGGFEDPNFRVLPTEEPVFDTAPRPEEAPEVGGSLKVASFNVLNYFTTIDGTGLTGPASDQNPRGADSNGTDPDGLTELQRQTAKIVAAINEIDADVLGLVEIENDPVGTAPGDTAIASLVAEINASFGGARVFDFVDTGAIEGAMGGEVEGDAIKVGFIYDTQTVSLMGDYAILDETVDARFQTVGVQRPSLAQTFTETATGESFTAVVNHFKSKGSVVNGESATGDGQGNNNPTRTAAAEALVDWIATDPTGSGDADFMILGDLNAYLMEDPVRAILAGADDVEGTADDFVSLVGPDDFSYGFPVGFDTVPQVQTYGTLDYALVSRSLFEQVTGSAEWHINASEATALDYNLDFQSPEQQSDLFAPDAFRASDHDPLLVGLDLGGGNGGDDTAPVLSATGPLSVRELAAEGTVVADVDADDASPTLFRIAGGNEAGAFAIDAATGVVTVADRGALGDGAGPFALTVEGVDASGNVGSFELPVAFDDLPTLLVDRPDFAGSRKDEAVIGTDGAERIDARGGDDVVRAGGGDDFVFGRRGDDDLLGGDGRDELTGGKGADSLRGGEDDDVLRGGKGDDLLEGGAGSDVLGGGAGADVLEGGAGNDLLFGSKGADAFVFRGDFGNDIVIGFRADEHSLRFDSADLRIEEVFGGVQVSEEGGTVLLLSYGLTAEDVESAIETFVFESV